jgi:hypothetical protein
MVEAIVSRQEAADPLRRLLRQGIRRRRLLRRRAGHPRHGGVERIVELELDPKERADFQKSVDAKLLAG